MNRTFMGHGILAALSIATLASPAWAVGSVGAAIAASLAPENPPANRSSDAEALQVLRDRAAQGLPDAQISLGEIYFAGSGVAQDYAEAAKWFRLAAKQGFPDTTPEIALGVMYADGKGVPKDATESLKWYLRAAEKGDPHGQLSVGTSYLMGRGTAVNYLEAYKWLTLCGSECENGPAAAAAIVSRKYISPAERSKADKWVRAWKPH